MRVRVHISQSHTISCDMVAATVIGIGLVSAIKISLGFLPCEFLRFVMCDARLDIVGGLEAVQRCRRRRQWTASAQLPAISRSGTGISFLQLTLLPWGGVLASRVPPTDKTRQR